MAWKSKSRNSGGTRQNTRSSSSSKKGRKFSSAQAHQHVGQSKYGYTKTYVPGKGFRMRKD